MALINCAECDAKISDQARVCPQCGMPQQNKPLANLISSTVNEDMYVNAILEIFSKEFFFSADGRVSRLQYAASLGFILISSLIIQSILFSIFDDVEVLAFILSLPIGIAAFISFINITIKRLHDLNQSGFLILTMLIPFIGFLPFLWVLFSKADEGSNQFGKSPYESKSTFTAQSTASKIASLNSETLQQDKPNHPAGEKSIVESFDSGQATWTDPATSLMWARISIGQEWYNDQCIGEAEDLDWNDAHIACQNFKLGGYDDWRLPTLTELKTLMIEKKAGYKCPENMLFKPKKDEWGIYWSASSDACSNIYSWYVYFSQGYASYHSKNTKYYVRAVRNA